MGRERREANIWSTIWVHVAWHFVLSRLDELEFLHDLDQKPTRRKGLR
jgi:hypothetical protein